MRKFFIGIITALTAAAACIVCFVGCDGGTGTDGGDYEPPHYGGGDIIVIPDPTLLDYTFTLNADGTGYVLTDADNAISGEIAVPATYQSLPVIGIGDKAFSGCKQLTSVVLPPAVESVGAYAFDNCKKLRGVSLPDGLTTIGAWAFCGCSALTAVAVPASVLEIGTYAFWSCAMLTDVIFAAPDGWCAYWSADAPVGADLTAADLTDPSRAAALLKATYNHCLWKRAADE